MKWSKYNILFKSEKYGYLIYNSITNSFAEIDKSTYQELKKIKKSPGEYNFKRYPALYLQLRKTKILIDNNEDEELLNVIKLKRLTKYYDNTNLHLTIAPTLACNFDCIYCYEESRRPIHMDEKTEDKIIEFIKRFGKLRYLSIVWFGGEPMLKFTRICKLTEKIKKLNIPFFATMITNGYLLKESSIGKLHDLKIKHIQITIDGPEEVHDKRRKLISDGKTFNRIINNIENLLDKWKGKLCIRVNVDKDNRLIYSQTYRYLRKRFKGKDFVIYPGIVHDGPGVNPDLVCMFDRDDIADFTIEQYNKYGIDELQFYPQSQNFGCVATIKNGFVIGPEGEIYKCWDDIGVKDMVVGSVFENKPWNMNLLANYMVGTNHFEDHNCKNCFYFPVCDGGCAHLRLLNKYGKENYDTCLKFKDRLPEMLEIYYEKKRKESAKKRIEEESKKNVPSI